MKMPGENELGKVLCNDANVINEIKGPPIKFKVMNFLRTN